MNESLIKKFKVNDEIDVLSLFQKIMLEANYTLNN